MLLVYENRNTGVSVEWKKPVHVPPHLHEAIEVVYVTDGEIELGVGQELFHMDEGDLQAGAQGPNGGYSRAAYRNYAHRRADPDAAQWVPAARGVRAGNVYPHAVP